MKFSAKRARLRSAWLLAPLYLILARPTPALIVAGALLALSGVLLRAWAAGTIRKNQVLAVGGPYAYTRNPLYVGSFLIGLGLVVAGARPSLLVIFLVLFTGIYGHAMRQEEKRLVQLFGNEYREYAERVPLFIPRVRPFRPGAEPPPRFRLERYLINREYEAALGVVLGFLALAAKLSWF